MPFKKGQPPPPKRPQQTLALTTTAKPESIIVKRQRAALIISDMANGMSRKDAAAKYNIALSTLSQLLRWAERENFFQRAEDAILHRLVPKAIDAYEKALDKAIDEGDYDAAEKLLKGVRLFASGGPARDQAPPVDDDDTEEVTWERFTARRKPREANPPNHPERPAASSPSGTADSLPTVDAEIIQPADGEAHLPGANAPESASAARSAGPDGGLHANAPPRDEGQPG